MSDTYWKSVGKYVAEGYSPQIIDKSPQIIDKDWSYQDSQHPRPPRSPPMKYPPPELSIWSRAISIATSARVPVYGNETPSHAAESMRSTIIRHLVEAARADRLERNNPDDANGPLKRRPPPDTTS